jgi:hypothetical protein
MTQQRVSEHRLAQERLADLERLRRLVVAQMEIEERESKDVSTELEELDGDEEGIVWDEIEDSAPGESPAVCFCGYPDAGDSTLAHILVHNREEVSGAVMVDWRGADPTGAGYPVPHLCKVHLVHDLDGPTSVQLMPVRMTIMSDAAAMLAVVDVTELVTADDDVIRMANSSRMPVHTEEYKAWLVERNRDHESEDLAFLGDKYVTKVSRFVLASGPGRS